jgi:hypothetical protein
MSFDYTYTLHTEIEAPLSDFDTFVRIWSGVADIATKGIRKRWKLRTYSNNLEFAFKKERHRDRFGERVDDLFIALRAGNHEALRALLPPRTSSRS